MPIFSGLPAGLSRAVLGRLTKRLEFAMSTEKSTEEKSVEVKEGEEQTQSIDEAPPFPSPRASTPPPKGAPVTPATSDKARERSRTPPASGPVLPGYGQLEEEDVKALLRQILEHQRFEKDLSDTLYKQMTELARQISSTTEVNHTHTSTLNFYAGQMKAHIAQNKTEFQKIKTARLGGMFVQVELRTTPYLPGYASC